MSRAYKIHVRESLRKVVTAKDRVSTRLEMLEILSADQMGALLAQELERRGFQRKGDVLTRSQDGVTITVEPQSGEVTVQAEAKTRLDLETAVEGDVFDDVGPSPTAKRKQLQEQAQKDLQRQADLEKQQLQSEVTDRLSGQLADLRCELDQAVNAVTAAALKEKAAQMGQIKEMTEDPSTGSLTIVVEV